MSIWWGVWSFKTTVLISAAMGSAQNLTFKIDQQQAVLTFTKQRASESNMGKDIVISCVGPFTYI